jgi:hypothetical protein
MAAEGHGSAERPHCATRPFNQMAREEVGPNTSKRTLGSIRDPRQPLEGIRQEAKGARVMTAHSIGVVSLSGP